MRLPIVSVQSGASTPRIAEGDGRIEAVERVAEGEDRVEGPRLDVDLGVRDGRVVDGLATRGRGLVVRRGPLRDLVVAAAALSAEHRAVIELTYYFGYACREIAQIMDCPVDTVKTRMFYARRHLKKRLDGELPDWI